jgi:hypothetical protein
MAYLTMEAEIDHGRITVAEPEKLPLAGKALLTVLESSGQNLITVHSNHVNALGPVPTALKHKPDLEVIKSVIGTLKTKIDAAEWQRRERSEWDERERKQWGDR